MAWTGPSATGFGENNNTTAGAAVGLGTLITSLAGEILIVAIATDNISTGDGNTNDHTSLVSDAGAFTKLYEFTNGQGAANAGACISLWMFVGAGTHTNAIHTASASLSRRGWVHGIFSFTGSGVNSVGTPQGLANDGADPGSMTLGSLANAEHLWIRATASESNSTTLFTASASWTRNDWGAGTPPVTGSGGSAANIGCRVEYRILTATTATSDPTLFSADHASLLVALDEVAAAPGPVWTRKPGHRFLTMR